MLTIGLQAPQKATASAPAAHRPIVSDPQGGQPRMVLVHVEEVVAAATEPMAVLPLLDYSAQVVHRPVGREGFRHVLVFPFHLS